MKKLLCITLLLLLLFGMAWMPCAQAQENHCALFDDAINQLRWNSPFWDVAPGDPFPVASIMGYTRHYLCIDEYGEGLIEENGYSYYATYAIPAEVFEAAAMDFFAVVDIAALRSYTSFFWDYTNFTGIDDFQNYQPDRHVYLFSNNGGMGDPSWYEVLGYTQEDGLYTVYSRFISLLWEEPTGEEGVDYIRIGEEYFAIEHYLRTVMAISNDRAQFHSWEEIDAVPDIEMVTPPNFVLQGEDVTIEADGRVFPEDVVIEIAEPDREKQQLVEDALSGLASDFVAYDITASVQPNGVVLVTFAIPQGFDPSNLALFYISEDGTAQQLDAVVDAEAGTIAVEVTHFSIYAVVQLQQDEPVISGDANGDGAVNARDARVILRYAAGLLEADGLDLIAGDVNDDGKVNARDARMILRQVAGLN